MNIFLVGAGYDEDGSHITDFVMLGTCPYWVPFLRDVDAHLATKFEWWNNNCSRRINGFLFNRINEVKKYAIESDEAILLEREVAPGKYFTWTAYPDTEDDGELVFALSLRVVPWDVLLFKRLWSEDWFEDQTDTLIELAIPEEDFVDFVKQGLTAQEK